MSGAWWVVVLAIAAWWWWNNSTGGNVNGGKIQTWADAIKAFEGWFPGSRSFRNNNPGNLRVAGDLGTDSGGYGVFSSAEAGMAALTSDLQAKARKYPNETLAEIMQRYAPASDGNDPLKYAKFVASKLGASVTDTLNSIFNS